MRYYKNLLLLLAAIQINIVTPMDNQQDPMAFTANDSTAENIADDVYAKFDNLPDLAIYQFLFPETNDDQSMQIYPPPQEDPSKLKLIAHDMLVMQCLKCRRPTGSYFAVEHRFFKAYGRWRPTAAHHILFRHHYNAAIVGKRCPFCQHATEKGQNLESHLTEELKTMELNKPIINTYGYPCLLQYMDVFQRPSRSLCFMKP